MKAKYFRIQTSLLLTVGFILSTAALTPHAEAALTMNGATINGITLNGIRFNGTHLKDAAPGKATTDSHSAQSLHLEGGQLVLQLQ